MNDRWRYSAVSITPYNPIYRGENGEYLKSDIFSVSDVGKSMKFNDYLKIENAYIESIKVIMLLTKCSSLSIRYLEKQSLPLCFSEEEEQILNDTYFSLVDKQIITNENLEVIMRLILRNSVWCDLVNLSKRLYVRFGYDYYMYFNTKLKVEEYKEHIEKIGLFVC